VVGGAAGGCDTAQREGIQPTDALQWSNTENSSFNMAC
jgi:hypothetical protein